MRSPTLTHHQDPLSSTHRTLLESAFRTDPGATSHPGADMTTGQILANAHTGRLNLGQAMVSPSSIRTLERRLQALIEHIRAEAWDEAHRRTTH